MAITVDVSGPKVSGNTRQETCNRLSQRQDTPSKNMTAIRTPILNFLSFFFKTLEPNCLQLYGRWDVPKESDLEEMEDLIPTRGTLLLSVI